jgi:hypothetical protein
MLDVWRCLTARHGLLESVILALAAVQSEPNARMTLDRSAPPMHRLANGLQEITAQIFVEGR